MVRLIGAHQVCTAVEGTLQAWLPSILATVAPDLAAPVSYLLPSDEGFRRGEKVPAVVVSSPGLSGTPVQDGDGVYRATWDVVVAVYVRGQDYEPTARAVREYVKACRWSLLTHSTLGGFASELAWTSESYEALERAQSRTLGGGYLGVTVTVADVMRLGESPGVPPVSGPIPDLPTVRTRTVTGAQTFSPTGGFPPPHPALQ